jgi:hypothetical protein
LSSVSLPRGWVALRSASAPASSAGSSSARKWRLDPDAVAQLRRVANGLLQLTHVGALVVGQLRPADLELRVAAPANGQLECPSIVS